MILGYSTGSGVFSFMARHITAAALQPKKVEEL